MNRLRQLLLLVCLLHFFTPSVVAVPQFETALSHSAAQVGESILLTLRISWPQSEANYSVALPNLQLENLTILRQGESQESFSERDEAWIKKTYTIELTPAQPGRAVIHPFKVSLIDPQSQKGTGFEAPSMEIQITSPPSAGPIGMGLGLSGATVLLLIIGLMVKVFSERRQKNFPPVERHSTPQDELLCAIHRTTGEVDLYPAKEKMDHLMNLCRRLIIQLYNLPGLSLSDSEILAALAVQGISSEEMRRLKNLFSRFEETRFAGRNIPASELKQLQNEILDYADGKKVLRHSLET